MKRNLIMLTTLVLLLVSIASIAIVGAGPGTRAYIEDINSTKVADHEDVYIEVKGTSGSNYTLNTNAGFLDLYNTSSLKYVYNTTDTVPGMYWINVSATDLMGADWQNFTLKVNNLPVLTNIGITGPNPPLGNLTTHTVQASYHDLDIEVPTHVTAYIDPSGWNGSAYTTFLHKLVMSVAGGGSYGDPGNPVLYESGSFTLPPGMHDLVVVTDDSWDVVQSDVTKIFASIEPAVAPITGHVKDMYDMDPIAANIMFERMDSGTVLLLKSPAATGNFSEPNFPVGEYTVWAEADGYYPTNTMFINHTTNGSNINLDMEPIIPFTFKGYVKGPEGQPIDATITVSNTTNDLELLTNSEGLFSTDLMFGTYSISVEAQGYLSDSTNITVPKSLGPNHIQWLNYTLYYDMADVWGYVVDPATGDKVVGALVVFENRTWVPTTYVGTSLASNDPDMRYELHLPVGEYLITVTADGYQTMTGVATIDGDLFLNLTLYQIPSADLELSFYYRGDPYAYEVPFKLTYKDMFGVQHEIIDKTISSYKLYDIGVYDVTLDVNSDEWYYDGLDAVIAIEEGQNIAQIHLKPLPLANLTGIVLVDSEPVKLVITFTYDDGMTIDTFSNEVGRYDLRYIKTGRVKMEVSLGVPYLYDSPQYFNLSEGYNTLDIVVQTIPPTPKYTISVGPILMDDNSPFVGMQVELSSLSMGTVSAFTDTTGMVMFSDIEEGGYLIDIKGNFDYQQYTQTVSVDENNTAFLSNYKLPLIPTYTLTVGPIQRNSDAREGVDVWLKDSNGNTIVEGETDEFGMLTFTGLKAGTYKVKYDPGKDWEDKETEVIITGDASVYQNEQIKHTEEYNRNQDVGDFFQTVGTWSLGVCAVLLVVAIVAAIILIVIIIAFFAWVIKGISNLMERRNRKKREKELERMRRAQVEKSYREGKAKDDWEKAPKLSKDGDDDDEEYIGRRERRRGRGGSEEKKAEEPKPKKSKKVEEEPKPEPKQDEPETFNAFLEEHGNKEHVPVSERLASKELDNELEVPQKWEESTEETKEEEKVEVAAQEVAATDDNPYDPGFDTLTA